MSIYRDRERSAFVFEFDRRIPGAGRVRARKRLPKTWTRAQADAFDRKESARLYALATGTEKVDALIEDAVTLYLKERVPKLKAGRNTAAELAAMFWAYQDKPLSALVDVCKLYRQKAKKADGSPLLAATVRNRIRYLSAACRFAWREHGLCDNDPAAALAAQCCKRADQRGCRSVHRGARARPSGRAEHRAIQSPCDRCSISRSRSHWSKNSRPTGQQKGLTLRFL